MNLPPWAVYGIFACAVIGHFAIHLAVYNRVNSFGLPRRTVKRIVKAFLLSCITIPILAAWSLREQATDLIFGAMTAQTLAGIGPFWTGYGVLCLLAWPLLGIPWLIWRPIWRLEWTPVSRQTEVANVAQLATRPLAMTLKCRVASRIPFNQLFELAIERIELPVAGLPERLDGYRIAHLSDLHFTGHISPQWTAIAVEQANAWSPDLFALTGDIIDHADCIDWLPEALGHARATDGHFFVLGNHDTRVADPRRIRRAMRKIGWQDIGGRSVHANVAARGAAANALTENAGASGSVRVQILGNERPWFGAPSTEQVSRSDAAFRLLLSHSPDQLWWARRHGVHLMLAGHTHGGQGRLPFAGPLLSPSWHGSRFASGDFFKPPTTMHVSRGFSGTHLLRINCRPELSLLTLRVRKG